MLVCKTHIYAMMFASIRGKKTHEYRVAGMIASIRGKKTHVYRVAGMFASIRGKKPHVYRVIILKQMADHIPPTPLKNKKERFARGCLLPPYLSRVNVSV